VQENRVSYGKVVNIAEDGEITVFDGTFNYPDGFKGATGSKFYPVTQAQIDERFENQEDELRELWQMAVSEGQTEASLTDWADSYTHEAGNSAFYDLSYENQYWDEIRSHGYPVEEYPIFDCVGGGRCFDADFQGNVNPELSEIIRQFEAK